MNLYARSYVTGVWYVTADDDRVLSWHVYSSDGIPSAELPKRDENDTRRWYVYRTDPRDTYTVPVLWLTRAPRLYKGEYLGKLPRTTFGHGTRAAMWELFLAHANMIQP